jgi:hypothetical protein
MTIIPLRRALLYSRLDARKRRAWSSVPWVSWLLCMNAGIMSMIGAGLALRLDPFSPTFRDDSDLPLAFLILGSLEAICALWVLWKARNRAL